MIIVIVILIILIILVITLLFNLVNVLLFNDIFILLSVIQNHLIFLLIIGRGFNNDNQFEVLFVLAFRSYHRDGVFTL